MFELILIDFSWLYNRYYYVAKYQADLKGIPFEERTGWIKTTLLSMLTSFFKVVKEKCFTAKILLALDTPTSELVGSPSKEGYKQNRDKEEKHEVYENLNAVISALSEDGKLTFIRAWGYEADHVIAYLAEKYCDSKKIPTELRAGNCKPLQYSCLGNPTDGGDWQATVYGVAKESDTT